MRVLLNQPATTAIKAVAPLCDPPTRAPLDFHRRLPGYTPTPLVDVPLLAARLGVGRVWVKDEAQRLGLPAFKILGAAWAVYRLICQRLGSAIRPWATIDELRAQIAPLGALTLVTATDGNHGRGVARVAAWLGWAAQVYVPRGTVAARIEAIESEGGRVVIVDGNYDEAVARAAADADTRHLLIADTGPLDTDPVPAWVIDGYSTLFWEIDDGLASAGQPWPDVVAVQVGVGALAAAAVRHFRAPALHRAAQPRLIGVEPQHAACVLASIEAGRPITLAGQQDSIMAGLNCGTPSPAAWPLISRGLDLLVAVEDDSAKRAMRVLAEADIVAGESGAAGLAGLLDLLTGSESAEPRRTLGVGPSTQVLLLSTEGATDPTAYAQIVGRQPHSVENKVDS